MSMDPIIGAHRAMEAMEHLQPTERAAKALCLSRADTDRNHKAMAGEPTPCDGCYRHAEVMLHATGYYRLHEDLTDALRLVIRYRCGDAAPNDLNDGADRLLHRMDVAGEPVHDGYVERTNGGWAAGCSCGWRLPDPRVLQSSALVDLDAHYGAAS